MFKYGAAAMFMRDNEFGFLDGLGTEIAPKPTLNKQERLYKKYTVPGILELTYPTLWQKNGNTINYRNERASLTIQYKHYSYSNDVKKWIKTKTQESDLKTMWIDGKEAFYFVKKKGVGYNAVYWTQNIYLPISSSTMVILEISCSDFFYPKNAQDIYDVVHSIRILK